MFETSAEVQSPIVEWCVRGGIGLAFVIFGFDKFSFHSMWPKFFEDVGLGQWFRYFTGIVEIMGGILTVIPAASQFGIAILALTMAGATVIWVYPIGHPGNTVITGAFCFGLSALWWTRRSRA